jgi:translation initiation factor 1
MAKMFKGKETSEGGFVFSTNRDFTFESENEFDDVSGEKQLLEAHLEKKGRAGKTAVIIKGFIGNQFELAALGKELKAHCGTGGTVKEGEIILQGDCRNKAIEFLKELGHTVKRVGG